MRSFLAGGLVHPGMDNIDVGKQDKVVFLIWDDFLSDLSVNLNLGLRYFSGGFRIVRMLRITLIERLIKSRFLKGASRTLIRENLLQKTSNIKEPNA